MILIAVDVVAIEKRVQADVLPEIRSVLERCIHAGQDVLLPSMSDAESVETFFIVACTGPGGFAVIASRIGRELEIFDNSSRLKPVISSTALLVRPGLSRKEQVGEITAEIERLIQAHLLGKDKRK